MYNPVTEQSAQLENLPLVIVGAGGHANAVADIAWSTGRNVLYFIDSVKSGVKKFGAPVLHSLKELPGELGDYGFVIAIGDNSSRERCASELRSQYTDIKFTSLFHRSANVSEFARVEQGVVVAAQAHIGPNSCVGPFCIVNTSASLDHDCSMDAFSSLAPGVRVGGNVHLGKRTAVCLGAIIKHGIEIGCDCVIGSGSYVHSSISNNQLVCGTPARIRQSIPTGWSYLA